MFRIYRIQAVVRIEPQRLSQGLEEAARKVLEEQFVARYYPDLGYVISILNVKVDPEGYIVFGDGATYHRAEAEILSYVPLIHEIVEGIVTSVGTHGLNVNLGALDAFVHVSQIADDAYVDKVRGAVVLRQSKKFIASGDVVRGMITSISYAHTKGLVRVLMTLKQPYLGKLEWIREYVAKEGK